jgi:hypothetical protein
MPMTITLTTEEANALAQLMDAGVKATGLQSAKAAAAILTKLEAAAAADASAPSTLSPEIDQ